MAVISGITFLGYIDKPEELLSGKRRCLFGCDDDTAAADLPTSTGLELANGGVTSAPAPWSMAYVRGGSTLVLGTDSTWSTLEPQAGG